MSTLSPTRVVIDGSKVRSVGDLTVDGITLETSRLQQPAGSNSVSVLPLGVPPEPNCLGKVEHVGDRNVVTPFGSVRIHEDSHTQPGECQHCGISRRKQDTFLFEEEPGSPISIGRRCLSEFLGDADRAAKLIRWSDAWSRVLRTLGPLDERQSQWPVGPVVALAAAWEREYGWKTGDRDHGELSSVDMLSYALRSPSNHELGTPLVTPTPEEAVEASAAVAWVEEHLNSQSDDRLTTHEVAIIVLCRGGFCDWSQIGLVCSIHRLYREWKDRPAVPETAASFSVHLGQPKERLKGLPILVTAILGPYAGQYGDSYLCKMQSGDNELIWWTGENLSLEVDRRYVVDGTVASHDEYNGTKQTRIQRVKVVEELQ